MTRRANDFYPTPHSIIAALLANWGPSSLHVWEPCAGDGRLVHALRARGYEVSKTDIAQGEDFFGFNQALAPCIVTNPPFKRIRQFIDHAFAIGVEEMALVCPERLWASGIGRRQFEARRPSLWINLDWREDYLGKGGSPDRALAVAIWERGDHSGQTQFEVWARAA